MKTFKEAWCAAVVVMMAGAAMAAPKVQVPCTEGYRSDRLMRTIVAPREAIDLQGTWLTAHTACKQTDTEKIELLNGKTYERKVMTTAEPDEKTVWLPAESPFVEGLLRGSCLWAKRTFVVPKLGERRALLRFESVEDGFTVFVNGKAYPQTAEPGYGLSWVRDITEALKEGENEIVISFPWIDFPNAKCLSRRGGAECAYGSTRGVRGPVQVEFVDPVHVTDVFVKTFVEGGRRMEVEVSVTNASTRSAEAFVEAKVKGEGEQWKVSDSVRLGAGEGKVVTLKGDWPEAHLWTPDDPFLYNLDASLSGAEGTPRPTDAYRTRFGFREFKVKGHRFTLNGVPFVARAGWALTGKTEEEMRQNLTQFKKRGFNAMRSFVGQKSNAAAVDMADEVGIFSMIGGCTENGGGGWDTRVSNDGRYDKDFWRNYESFNEKFVRDYRNHPGVIVWSLGCEFGAIYCGQGSGREKVTSERICAAAEKVMKLDPTRTWCENGGVEVGCPIKGRGPCPTRSFHYPVPLNTDGSALPDVAYWYPDGVVSWQKVADFEKPTVITEDCYHGMQDSLRCMTRFGDDAVYTAEGYVKALREGFNRFAEGYYLGGLAWWEPWMPYGNIKDNDLFGDYEKPSAANDMKGAFHDPEWQCIPEWMVAMRPFYANLTGGAKDERTLYVYNQTFTRREVELVRIDTLDGAEVARTTETFAMEPGAKRETKVELLAPEVQKTGVFTVRYELKAVGEEKPLTVREFAFTVFPKAPAFGNMRGYALLAETNSPLMALAKSFGRATDDVGALFGPKGFRGGFVVVDKLLTAREGKRLDDFVTNGGKVLLIDAKEGSWSPVEPLYGKTVRRAWRRNGKAMAAFPPAALACWRDDDCVTTSCLPKNGDEDTCVLEDCGLPDGLSAYVTGWLFRGKGAYLLSQMPVTAKWSVEPAAPHYFAALLAEMNSRATPKLGKRFAAWKCGSTNEHVSIDRDILQKNKLQWRHVKTTGPSYATIFRESGILEGQFANPLDEADVVVLDASCGLTRELIADADRVLARPNTTVVVMEIPDDADRTLAFELGFALKGTRRWKRDANGDYVPDTESHAMGEFPYWTNPSSDGEFAGLTADDFLWYRENILSSIMDQAMVKRGSRIRIPHDDSLMTAEIVPMQDLMRDGRVLCNPCAAVSLRRGKGRIILSTLRFRSFYGRYARRERFILRTLLNNLGCSTSVAGKVYEEEPLDISKAMNRNLWRDPLYRKGDGVWEPEAWFGDDNDFRYFPVNLCGWSTAANNFCPKGVFPKQPMLLAGNRFLVQDPEKNGGKAVIHFAADEEKTVRLVHPVKADRFRLLGTASHAGKTAIFETVINGKSVESNGEDHFGVRWWASSRPKGKVAWAGETPKDPNGGIYSWVVDNPEPEKDVVELSFRNRITKGEFVLLAVTAEREAK